MAQGKSLLHLGFCYSELVSGLATLKLLEPDSLYGHGITQADPNMILLIVEGPVVCRKVVDSQHLRGV